MDLSLVLSCAKNLLGIWKKDYHCVRSLKIEGRFRLSVGYSNIDLGGTQKLPILQCFRFCYVFCFVFQLCCHYLPKQKPQFINIPTELIEENTDPTENGDANTTGTLLVFLLD